MEIRKLTMDDAEAFRDIRIRGLNSDPYAFSSSPEDDSTRDIDVLRERFGNFSNSNFILGCFEGDKIIGVVGFARESYLKRNHIGFIWGMYVDMSFRGKKFGSELFRKCIEEASKCDGLEIIELGVAESNISAVSLYKNNGFVEYGKEIDAIKYNGKYYDEYLMYKRVNE
ncbi:GNAT family N-acetyltransferase [soil metagenome]